MGLAGIWFKDNVCVSWCGWLTEGRVRELEGPGGVGLIPPRLHRMMQRGKKFITPLMKSDLTAASINCLKLGPASPLTKKVTGTLDVHTDWMGDGE